MRNKNKKLLLKLIHKLIDGSITKQGRNKLFSFFVNNQKISSWPEEFSNKEDVEKNIFNKVKLEISNNSNKKPIKLISFIGRKSFKYSIAASLLILLTVTYYLNRNSQSNKFNEPPIIVKNNIKIGTDKATLTLEDGTVIALEKGQHYNSDNLESNGVELVYKAPSSKKTEVLYNYLTIPRGGQYHVFLSDGTEIWLNSDSKLKYPVSFIEGKPREVELVYGEAYFKVTKSNEHHGDAFTLKTDKQNITVLGTAFNVKAYRDETEVFTTLVEGSVSLSNKSYEKLLSPGQQSKLSQNTGDFDIYPIDVEDEISWRKGMFSFTNKPLKDIMKVLSRWYDVDIIITNNEMKNIEFTGVLNKQQSILKILEIIRNTNNMTYTFNNRNLIIE
ncbi:FecR family protein [Flavivirga jejuensis]|uniref:DUF4974 domain-containing protein n=1 Tax=Flavivirga jejuensis TaxID=870487 RepID=A0ABT8WR01_9FLAO|nr:FecR family protein [Flavivirga jejuensis]MDO5975617.1 DUF4974 domain-containing protein [Flavivirga jejuensis]